MTRTITRLLSSTATALAVIGSCGSVALANAVPATVAVCGAVRAGEAHCDAALLARPGTHTLLRPHVPSLPAGGFGVRTSLRGGTLAGRRGHSVGAAATSEPSPGSPQWIQQAYDFSALSATRGSGDTVAVVDAYADPGAASDMATFRATYGLPACTQASGCLRIVNEQGAGAPLPGSSSSWAVEETLDLQAVAAICPNCNILLVEANSASTTDLQVAMATAAALGANQISDSWSVSAGGSPFSTNLVRGALSTPAIFAAAGDSGAITGTNAEYPAALPTVTAVGGTTLSLTSAISAPRGYSESAWSNSGSGCALNEPALPYQPSSGCAGRAYADVSADADPNTGLNVYEAAGGGWASAGGTSLATPMVAAFTALTSTAAQGPQWAYADAAKLNDPTGGANGSCGLLCGGALGYDGPTGAGSISGDVVAGAPGIAGPLFQVHGTGSDVVTTTSGSLGLSQGLYTNNEVTSYAFQYGPTSSYGAQSASATLAAGSGAVIAAATISGLSANSTYHYRLVAVNASGTVYGPDMTATTAGGSSHLSAGQAQGSTPSLAATGTTHTSTAVKRWTRAQAIARARRAAQLAKARRAAKLAKARRAAKLAKAHRAAKLAKTHRSATLATAQRGTKSMKAPAS